MPSYFSSMEQKSFHALVGLAIKICRAAVCAVPYTYSILLVLPTSCQQCKASSGHWVVTVSYSFDALPASVAWCLCKLPINASLVLWEDPRRVRSKNTFIHVRWRTLIDDWHFHSGGGGAAGQRAVQAGNGALFLKSASVKWKSCTELKLIARKAHAVLPSHRTTRWGVRSTTGARVWAAHDARGPAWPGVARCEFVMSPFELSIGTTTSACARRDRTGLDALLPNL